VSNYRAIRVLRCHECKAELGELRATDAGLAAQAFCGWGCVERAIVRAAESETKEVPLPGALELRRWFAKEERMGKPTGLGEGLDPEMRRKLRKIYEDTFPEIREIRE
jgi:hypothetical protein